MALIKCPECKKKVSEQCYNCPNCGYPIKENIERKNAEVTKVAIVSNIIDSSEKKIEKAKKPINKKVLITIITIASVILIACGIIGYNALLPRINATKNFKAAVTIVEEKNLQLDTAIKKSEDLILEEQPLLDENLIPALETAISNAKAIKELNLKTPNRVEDIVKLTETLYKVDYSTVIANLDEKHTAVVTNAKRYQLVNQPTEAYIIQCLQNIPEIVNISAVTEDNDPNGNLNKAGGYTASVYFAVESIILDKSIYGETLIEQGTDAGGCIEVYACVADAVKRSDYLATFDGGILASGTHTVIGTVLIRTSNELTASQQKNLEAKIITSLTYLPESDKTITEQNTLDNVTSTPSTIPDTTSTTTSNTNTEKPSNDSPISTKPNNTTSTPTTQNTTSSSTNNKTEDKKDNDNTVTKPVNRNQMAVAEAINQAKLWFPTDRHFIEYILANPSLEEGFDAFTEAEAAYAIENANIDWKNHALHKAKESLAGDGESCFSQNDIYFLVKESGGYCGCTGFTEEEIQYAVDNCGVNWKAKAISDMKSYWNYDYNVIVSLYDFYNYLDDLGYDSDTIEYAINNTSGYYRGEAMESDQELVELLLSYGYTREAIINWYSQTMDYPEAEALVNSCI